MQNQIFFIFKYPQEHTYYHRSSIDCFSSKPITIVGIVADNGLYAIQCVQDGRHHIPDTIKATLFDRSNLVTTRAKGKDFGLCLIMLLVDDYHGKFWIEDRVHCDYTKGTRFTVMLPAAEM